MQPVFMFTDGSCDGKTRKGGYAAVIRTGKIQKEVVGSLKNSTINSVELIAVIRGLSAVNPGSSVRVFTDSQYVERAINEGHLMRWKANGWKRIKIGTPVVNANLWQVLLETIEKRNLNVSFEKIKAHNGCYFNDRADYLAKRAAEKCS